MSERTGVALKSVLSLDSLVSRSSLGTAGARALGRRVAPDAVRSVVDQVVRASERPVTAVPEEVKGYTTPESLPRPHGQLTRSGLELLAADASGGDPAAIQSLLQLIGPLVVRYCRARLGGRDLAYLTADDVAQEVCIAVLQALPGYQNNGGPFLRLVYGIAANKVADAYLEVARNRAEPVTELPERATADDEEPERHALHHDLGERLSRLLRTLPQIQQEVLTLRIAVGLSAVETAEALGCSPGSVRVTQHRALARLRSMVVADSDF